MLAEWTMDNSTLLGEFSVIFFFLLELNYIFYHRSGIKPRHLRELS